MSDCKKLVLHCVRYSYIVNSCMGEFSSEHFLHLVHRCFNYWFWVPLVAPMLGGTVGSAMYLIFIQWHLPDSDSEPGMSPAGIPVTKYPEKQLAPMEEKPAKEKEDFF